MGRKRASPKRGPTGGADAQGMMEGATDVARALAGGLGAADGPPILGDFLCIRGIGAGSEAGGKGKRRGIG